MRLAGVARSAALALAVMLPLGPGPAARADPMQVVVLGGLDKVTAHVSTFEAPVGKTVSFGALKITARACDKHPPEETPHTLFSGWMFASSPALSAMDNPIYDLWVLDCKNPASASAGTSP